MRFIAAMLIALSLSACQSVVQKRDISPVQNYRFEGDKDATPIAGWLEKYGNAFETDGYYLTVAIGSEQVIVKQPLDKRFLAGEVYGREYKGKQVSANCSSKQTSDHWVDIRCLIFVGNEKTVTLTF